MFLGHFGLGLAAKKAVPQVSLGTYFLCAQLLDLLWPTLLLLGVEQVEIAPAHTAVTPLAFTHYPISHSLFMVVIWGVVAGGLYFWTRGSRVAALICTSLVISHWILDLITHIPDLPLSPWSSTKVGLGLWNSFAGTIALELALFTLGLWYYWRTTEPRNHKGIWGLWGLVGFLVLVYLSNLTAPPPPDQRAIAWVGQAQWLLVLWAYWVDRHRTMR